MIGFNEKIGTKKKMATEQMYRVISIFIIALIVSMPIYAADAMASSVQVVQNHGEKGIEGALDAQGDVWKVQALVSGVDFSGNDSISSADVKLKIGNLEEEFKSCSSTPLGFVCDYVSPLTDGVKEGTYPFTVQYQLFKDKLDESKNPGASGTIIADGSGPVVSGLKVMQSGKDLELDFMVDDKVEGKASVGLKSIQVLDVDSGKVLYAKDSFEKGVTSFSFSKDSGTNGKVAVGLEGQGLKRVKVIAVDMLGHSSDAAAIQTYMSDFVLPVVNSDSLKFVSMGKFIGGVIVKSDVTVDVTEQNLNGEVYLSSEQLGVSKVKANCEADTETLNLWHCRWTGLEVKADENVAVKVLVVDTAGNEVVKEISRSFTKDTSMPVVEFFGTERVFEGKSYLGGKLKDQRIVLQAKDMGVGITTAGISANLKALGKSNTEMPQNCTAVENALSCFWDVDVESSSSGSVVVGLSKFKDNVGNEGKVPEVNIVIDNTAPKVEKVEVYGVSEVGDKDYIQSNDKLKLKMRIAEDSGVVVLIDMNELVTDAATKYPANVYTRSVDATGEGGWASFTQENNCKRKGDTKVWDCVFETAALRSGPEDNMELNVVVQDTAGNAVGDNWGKGVEPKNVKKTVKGGEYTIDLLGLSTEANPDYWEVGKVSAQGGASAFIDLDTTPLTYTRLPFTVQLKSKGKQHVEALNIEMLGCAAKGVKSQGLAFTPTKVEGKDDVKGEAVVEQAPKVSRNILYGGKSAKGAVSPTPTVVLEFEPFDGKKMFNLVEKYQGTEFDKHEVEFVCQLRVYSNVGGSAVNAPEVQDVTLKVPFAFSTLGAPDANLDQLIAKEKEAIDTGLWGTIGTMNKVVKWIDYALNAYQVINGAYILLDGPVKASSESIKAMPGVGEAGRLAACFGFSGAAKGIDIAGDTFDVPLQILTCRGEAKGLGWYSAWQKYLLDLYNVEIWKSPDSPLAGNQPKLRPARDLRDNLFLSLAGLCVPGIVKNLDKYRQIKCRKLYCYKNEVKAGLATVDMCNKLEGLLECKYFLGEVWYLIPFSQFYDKGIKALWNAFKDPIAVAHTVNIVACGIQCTVSSSFSTLCSYSSYIWKVIDELEAVVSTFISIKADVESGGLQYCDSVMK